jgi:hypothetical protein
LALALVLVVSGVIWGIVQVIVWYIQWLASQPLGF